MATILAIESSCDETSIAIIKDDELLANVVATQISMHQQFGGVMPELASRLHCENVLYVLDEAVRKANIKLEDVDAFAFTRGPGLVGALHIGMQVAKTLAMLYDKPLIPVHHLAAHIYANEYVKPLKFPLLSIVVSGGNTEFVYMKESLDFEIIGETKDDAIGECFDKVARTVGLPYPGGIPIDKLSKEGKHTYKLPFPLHDDSLDFSYSGLKTAVINLVNNEKQKGHEINVPDLCKSFQDVAVGMIMDRLDKALDRYDIKQVVLAGGVSANSYLREMMHKRLDNTDVDLIVPPIWCTTDNAAMIARLASHLYDLKIFAPLSVSADPNWRIDKYKIF
ncbi:MAG: tRNA (adenosine(37)-N6)-threonylcarbamoyltransferase complex transferase subunit TsaD [Bacilli bacterium]|nr:tRNA (adenosine(37)-N6)-threonylcarbamoyltransferase complex transferase subunit TsaD [Erysipelotrichaceae bacterium]MDY4819885.1 tRNA (adenosine(37)-N6)-threonylcarbamoyltransferase complex transferase subunit TsaD [Bacilli bacterium]